MADPNIIARFETPEQLLSAVKAARRAGYRRLEAYAPFPVPGLAEALSFRDRRIPMLALAAALLSALVFYLMQWASLVLDYPFVVGGKPLNSWPVFLIVTFEMGILGAVLTAFLMMLVGNRLPKLYHPVFDWASFDRASDDSFFLQIEDPDGAAVTAFFRDQQAAEIEELRS
jgi:hypothetical protein